MDMKLATLDMHINDSTYRGTVAFLKDGDGIDDVVDVGRAVSLDGKDAHVGNGVAIFVDDAIHPSNT